MTTPATPATPATGQTTPFAVQSEAGGVIDADFIAQLDKLAASEAGLAPDPRIQQFASDGGEDVITNSNGSDNGGGVDQGSETAPPSAPEDAEQGGGGPSSSSPPPSTTATTAADDPGMESGPVPFTPPPETQPQSEPQPQAQAQAQVQPQPHPQSQSEPPDLNVIFDELLGSRPTPQEVADLILFSQDISSLPPERQALLGKVLSGELDASVLQQQPQPHPQPQPQPSPQPSPQPQPQPQSQYPTPNPNDPWGFYSDDPQSQPQPSPQSQFSDPRVDQLTEQITTLQQAIQSQQQQQQDQERAQWYEWVNQEQARGVEAFTASHPDLSETDIAILRASVTRDSLVATHWDPNNPAQSQFRALETAYMTSPRFREAEVERRAAEKAAQLAQAHQVQSQRGAVASALAGGGSAASAAPANLNPEMSRQAAVNEIAQALNTNSDRLT